MLEKEFVKLVVDMRCAQIRYFAGKKSSEQLSLAKELERKVDRAAAEFFRDEFFKTRAESGGPEDPDEGAYKEHQWT